MRARTDHRAPLADAPAGSDFHSRDEAVARRLVEPLTQNERVAITAQHEGVGKKVAIVAQPFDLRTILFAQEAGRRAVHHADAPARIEKEMPVDVGWKGGELAYDKREQRRT